ncbi:sigma-70 family RNA polymerase sigma factor [Variovorax sp. UMC13]|uniref:sigma-70 family RNA polymerase sigma factor n=1 Tax=Variovorax sp. UMC13 TaxID=1862326 RepID=UPI0015FEE7DB|nr:sigma-70 family RNA polymerase sigma factor [Variovorax sp. UMC13]MBB1601687.1 RNA polymerase subunit sigma [Variovorax sp. UMC13]
MSAASADPPAFHPLVQAFYVEHHGWLQGWLRRKLDNPFDAADLAQDTFVRLLGAPGLERVDAPRAYLTTVARNLLINHVRRRAIEQAYLDALALLPEPVAPPPEQRLMVLETLVEIDRRLSGLPVQAKKAFLLAQLEGLGQAEIAAALGLSVSTVKRHLAKAAMRCFFPA